MPETWSKALELLKARLDPVQFEMWLSPIRPALGGDGSMLLEVPDEFFARWIRDNYLELIKDALWDTTRRPLGVEFAIRGQMPTDAAPPHDLVSSLAIPASAAQSSTAQASAVPDADRLVPRFTFDNFLVGTSNEVAHSACEFVSANPGAAYNPLFLYGGVGLGKTHLLHAIGHELRRRRPQLRVLYTFGESYVNEVMTAMKNGRLDALRYQYRGQCDILLMDDVHYLAGREFAQEEFFHTFNELYNAQKQIVFTSDQVPSSIPKVSERLRSRFEWGLVADIAPPDEDLRVRILLCKAARDGIDLPGDVARFLAQRFPTSVRELEGALNRVTAHSLIRKVPLTADLARRLTEQIVSDRRGRLTPELILKVVAEYFQLQAADLKSPRRHRAVSVPRQVAMYVIRRHTSASLPTIGALFGGRSHSTVLTALAHLEGLLMKEPATERAVRDIERQLGL
jgi:chromosomal replication initiator protein